MHISELFCYNPTPNPRHIPIFPRCYIRIFTGHQIFEMSAKNIAHFLSLPFFLLLIRMSMLREKTHF